MRGALTEHSIPAAAVRVDTVACRTSKTHNSRPVSGATASCSSRIRKRTGMPWSAWSRWPDVRIRDRSMCFAIATRSLQPPRILVRLDIMRHLRPTRRTRLRLTLLAVLSLLFQQVAFASYICGGSSGMPMGDVAMRAHCAGMPMTQQKQVPALCTQHCAQQTASTPDARLPNVPPLLLPALIPAQPTLTAWPVSHTAHVHLAARRTSGIPPALRFRVLLI